MHFVLIFGPPAVGKMTVGYALFRQQGGTVYFVELEAEQEERIRRNKTPFRLEQKASKRDIVQSERRLFDTDQRYKLNSDNDFFYQEKYLKINNTRLSPQETAQRIVDAFGFPRIGQGDQ